MRWILLVLLIAACAPAGTRNRGLVDRLAPNRDGPDEFSILPQKPLEIPEDLASLPDPGGTNRADLDPIEMAVTALGGTPGTGGLTTSEAALVAALGPRAAGIRATLEAEDVQDRRLTPGRLLDRVLAPDQERRIYSDLLLNAEAELVRLRRAGIRTPAAPPPN